MNRKQLLSICIVAALVAGCSPLTFPSREGSGDAGKTADKSGSEKASASPMGVKVDGQGVPLRDGQVATTKSTELLPTVQRLVEQKRGRSLRAVIQQRPDMALEVLRDSLSKPPASPALAALAKGYDDVMGLPSDHGWQLVIKERAKRGDVYVPYATAREDLLNSMRVGKSTEAMIAELGKRATATSSEMVMLDAIQLQGMAWLITDQPKKAAAVLAQATTRAAQLDPYQSIHSGLLLSDALRRSGRVPDANQAWSESITWAAQLASRPAPLVDPTYWDKASYLRPNDHPWPQEVAAALVSHTAIPTNLSSGAGPADLLAVVENEEPESIVWGAIGQTLLERDDNQAALIALKRAETTARTDANRGWFRLEQAVCLVRLNQIPAATAVLVALASSPNPQLVNAATATLGGIKFRQGDPNSGFRLLSKAVEQEGAAEWTGRSDAEADLGLAYLTRGEEQKGLKLLHSAQTRYAGANDDLGLAKSLRNEAEYFKHTKRKQHAAEVQARIDAHESDIQVAAR